MQSSSNDPEHRGFVFFPQKENVGPFVSSFSPLCFNHPELVASSVEKSTCGNIFSRTQL